MTIPADTVNSYSEQISISETTSSHRSQGCVSNSQLFRFSDISYSGRPRSSSNKTFNELDYSFILGFLGKLYFFILFFYFFGLYVILIAKYIK